MQCELPAADRLLRARLLKTDRYLFAGALVVVEDEVLVDFAGAPRSDCGTFGAGLDSGSQPTANAPTQIERINANGLRMVSNPLRMFASRIKKIRLLRGISRKASGRSLAKDSLARANNQ